MNEMIIKFLLAGDKFMPEMHLKQPAFTYSACGPFTKNKEIIQKFADTGDTIDKLNDIVNEYNNAYHRTIKMKPVNVKDMFIQWSCHVSIHMFIQWSCHALMIKILNLKSLIM